ncbi:hypothetical protein AMS69_02380 [Haloarcula rubripromontorii]|uniref:Uncharacterized protein n=1 Tax=Haloarcula rubripromontorii TaxID=1705562 RepID=A0A0M9ALY6_9EURY|nr:hypothetical protein [Haloarcula rubripromontorii]KOX94727.1 hypothetical protein AMS69_02380 [Haloarcula rubripromontorii]
MARVAGWQLLVLTVVVTAGCGGLGFSGDDGSPPPVTPAPVPTDSATAYPAGVGPTGVTSPSLLGSAHGDRLNGTGYTLTMTRTVRYANGSLRSHLRVHVALDRNRTHLANISVRGHAAPVLLGRPPATASFWSDGDTYLRRLVRDNQTVYNEYDPPDSYAGTWQYWVHTAALNGRPAADVTRTVAPFHTRTSRSERSDEAVYVISGDRLRDNATSTVWTSRENATLVAHVTRAGLVRDYRTEYTTVTDGGDLVTVTRTVRFTGVGNTTVGPPPWRDRAQSTPG